MKLAKKKTIPTTNIKNIDLSAPIDEPTSINKPFKMVMTN